MDDEAFKEDTKEGDDDDDELYGEIVESDKVFARLIDKTYEGSRENFGNYKYVNSLKLTGSIISGLISPFFGGLSVGGENHYINHYYDEINNRDVFAIRGTQGLDDLINDGATLFREKLGYTPESVQGKLDKFTDFILRNSKSGNVVVAGHSLGSLDLKYIQPQLKSAFGDNLTTLGFAFPVWKPDGIDRAYVYENDPLYSPLGRAKPPNLIVLQKPFDRSGGLFKNYHSTKNFY